MSQYQRPTVESDDEDAGPGVATPTSSVGSNLDTVEGPSSAFTGGAHPGTAAHSAGPQSAQNEGSTQAGPSTRAASEHSTYATGHVRTWFPEGLQLSPSGEQGLWKVDNLKAQIAVVFDVSTGPDMNPLNSPFIQKWTKRSAEYVPVKRPDLSNGVANALITLNKSRCSEAQQHFANTFDEEMESFRTSRKPSLKFADHATMVSFDAEARRVFPNYTYAPFDPDEYATRMHNKWEGTRLLGLEEKDGDLYFRIDGQPKEEIQYSVDFITALSQLDTTLSNLRNMLNERSRLVSSSGLGNQITGGDPYFFSSRRNVQPSVQATLQSLGLTSPFDIDDESGDELNIQGDLEVTELSPTCAPQ